MAPRDDSRMQLVVEIRAAKKTKPLKYKLTILSKEDIEPMIADTLGQADTSMISADQVDVVTYVIKPGGRPSCHQEYPCRTEKIKGLAPILSRGLKAALTEPDKEDFSQTFKRGISNVQTIGAEGFTTIMRLKSGINTIRGMGLTGQPPNPAAALGGVRDLISTFGSDDGDAANSGAPDILNSLMGMITNPNASGADMGQMLSGLLGSMSKDPETAPLATMLGGLLNGLK